MQVAVAVNRCYEYHALGTQGHMLTFLMRFFRGRPGYPRHWGGHSMLRVVPTHHYPSLAPPEGRWYTWWPPLLPKQSNFRAQLLDLRCSRWGMQALSGRAEPAETDGLSREGRGNSNQPRALQTYFIFTGWYCSLSPLDWYWQKEKKSAYGTH